MLGYVYGKHIAGSDSNFSYRALQPSQDLAIKIASPAGSLLGQLLFGWLADLLGRKRMCKAIPLPAPLPISDETTPLSLPSFRWHRINYHDHWYLRSVTLGRGGCGQHHRCAIHMEIHRECGLDYCNSMLSNLNALSTQMGIGIGGDYPLSAVIASEFSATRFRGRLMSSVFAAQGWGNLSKFRRA